MNAIIHTWYAPDGAGGHEMAKKNPPSGRLPAAKRKAQLLHAAAKVFAQYGYSGTTTAELAKAAGITEPIIYRHFSGKRELFIALVEQTGEETIHEWEEQLRTAKDPAERLSRLVTANPMVMTRERILYRVIVQAMMEVEDADIRAALHKHVARLKEFIQAEVERAQALGQVSKRFSPEITAWALIDLAIGYGVLTGVRVPGHGLDRTGSHVADVIGQLMLGERYKRAEG